MNFHDILKSDFEGYAYNPYAGRYEGEWLEGGVSVDFLNKHFSQYSTVEEMINATESEGLKMFFAWLKEKGILN